ncbi:PLP-dependent aminotransferase family protein [Bacillus luteolus]|uniref:PLP-dependent aminotransferase family protein n=1 Tax=Litchfieldia luteola TaxID=682179 RepID=A0ABR9QIP8_9BACI|nr:PLP-dependent aminotransferase family protein [Cytobacillus luteolus]MBE4908381.1 PLP-dependent aminotransferase family protein [Cytobacillus luteolus]MBP1943169.1 GntR family transcriptional regulator/MocR family aminotransferase [Cytobacillus luteolus]
MWFHVDRSIQKTLTQQIYEQLRNSILNGELNRDVKLPSTRELSTSIGVSRNIVLEVYNQLVDEGYLIVRPRSGTFVAPGSSLIKLTTNESKVEIKKQNKGYTDVIDFRAATPAMDHFPRKVWGRLAKEVCYEAPDQLFGYHSPEGLVELKEELSRYLLRTRGVVSDPAQIIITSGATQALSLITELLLKENQLVAVEDPVTDEMRTIFSYGGATIIPVPVDDKGIQPEFLSEDTPPSFIFILPSHQFPLGGTLTIQRRIQLIEYARKFNCYIVEDDYDSEFTYEGTPVHSVQGLDPERVLYVGTFSKILSPALRIGYVVLPEPLIEECKKLKWYTDRHHPSLEQLMLTRFIKEGFLDRHIRKMKRIYKQRREALVSSLKNHFPDSRILGHAAGMHLVVEIPSVDFNGELLDWIKKYSIQIYPVEYYSIIKGLHNHKIVLGYGGLAVEKIEEGVSRLSMAIKSYKK